MKKLRIAIISNDDKLWSLYAWNNVFNTTIFNKEYECAGLWTCNQKYLKKNSFESVFWILKTFRFWNFFKIICFAISFKFFSFIKSIGGKYHLTFSKLCKANNIPSFHTSSPNNIEFINWVKANDIDILIIMVDQILKKDIINAPKIGIINKHAGLLPSNKGLYPFFWAKIAGNSHGISFHKVNEKIDEGDLYYQEKVTDPRLLKSMITFYFYVHKNYFKMFSTALENIAAERKVPYDINISSSYHSLPTVKDYIEFKKKGGTIICWSDIFLPVALFKKN